MMSQSCRRDCGSRPVVGSSRKSSSGSPTSAHATASRCFCPPESLPTYDVAPSLQATRGRWPRRVRGRWVEAAKQRDVSRTVSLSESWVSCSEMPMPLANASESSRPQRIAEHLDIAGRRVEQAFEDLDRRRLAGAVGTEQAEALANGNRQVDALHGLDRRPAGIDFEKFPTSNCVGHRTRSVRERPRKHDSGPVIGGERRRSGDRIVCNDILLGPPRHGSPGCDCSISPWRSGVVSPDAKR